MARPIALQLYTVRNEMEKDFLGTIRKVAEMGYEGVQFGDLEPFTATEWRILLDDLGLQPAGRHVGLERLEEDLEAVLDEGQALKDPDLICPALPEDRRRTAADWQATAALFNRIGAACQDRGFFFGYHNHSFEFQVFDGRLGLDILIEETNPEWVTFELDTYWVQHGGGDPLDYLRRCRGRVRVVHLKDMADDETRSFAAVGTGILDWDAILPGCEEAGAQWFCVEQDVCPGPSLESARISLENLRKMTKK